MKSIPLYIVCLLTAVSNMAAQVDTSWVLEADQAAGFYEQEVKVALRRNVDASIYYTLDGSVPTRKDTRYERPITLTKTQVLKARMINDTAESGTLVNTYFIDEPPTQLPVVSVSTEPLLLFDTNRGLFKKGPRAAPSFPYRGANFYSRKEYLCKLEIFETNQSRVFSGTVGFKIFGGMSRIFPQKSLAIYARKEYGHKWIRHPIFPDRELDKYKRLVLRNSGSDYGETQFRDGFITSLGEEMGLPVQAYRPCLVYINGRYWGLMNLREKLTKHYFQQHFNVDKDSIHLMENQRYVQQGSRASYTKMQAYMRKHDLADDEHFEKVASMMDVDNFMEYQIIQMYIDNQDAGGNVKFWRPMADTGRWQWVLFDTDFGFGHYSKGGYHFNSVVFHTEPNGPRWPNPPWSTFNLRMLLGNEGFKKGFVTRFCDRMNSVFKPEHVLARIDSMVEVIEPEMSRHWKRWGLTPKDWTFRVEQMREFGRKRPAYVRKHLQQKFPEIGDPVLLKVQSLGQGKMWLNQVIGFQDTFSGYYFTNLRVDLRAQSRFGWRFSHWEINGQKIPRPKIKLQFGSPRDHLATAVFKEGEHTAAKQVIINEISCRDTVAGDWIEFYNSTNEDLNLTGWVLKDGDGHRYRFPYTVLKAGAYLVLVRNLQQFQSLYTGQEHVLDGLSFGLDRNKDQVKLYDSEGQPVDSVSYDIGSSKDSIMLSLALRDFEADNSNFKKHWKYDVYGGSPGTQNPQYTQWKNKAQSASNEGANLNQFMQAVRTGLWLVGGFVVLLLLLMVLRKWNKKA